MSDHAAGHDVEAIKAANPLPEFLAKRGVVLKRHGAVMQGKCPFHQEKNGEALTVWPEENRWRCFGRCDAGGDVIEAVKRLDDVSFKEACARLGSEAPKKITIPTRKEKPQGLTAAQVAMQATAVRALATDPHKCAAIAKRRGWQPETIKNLALDNHLGIHEGKLAFIYNHGLKLRWQQAGERKIAWAFGGNSELWRQDRLTLKQVRRVFITEGETDAISLVDAGAENDSSVAVVAIPGASCWRPEWNALFTAREVLVMTDADAAGEKAAAKILSELASHASRVARINPLALLDPRSTTTS